MAESRQNGRDTLSPVCLQQEEESPSSSPELREIFKGAAPLGRRVKFYISGGEEIESEEEDGDDDDDGYEDIGWQENNVAVHTDEEVDGVLDSGMHNSSGSALYRNSEPGSSSSILSYAGVLLPRDLLSTEDEVDMPDVDENSDDDSDHSDVSLLVQCDPNEDHTDGSPQLQCEPTTNVNGNSDFFASTFHMHFSDPIHRVKFRALLPNEAPMHQNGHSCHNDQERGEQIQHDTYSEENNNAYGGHSVAHATFSGDFGAPASLPFQHEPPSNLQDTISNMERLDLDGDPHDLPRIMNSVADLQRHLKFENVPGVYCNTDIEQADIAHFHFPKHCQMSTTAGIADRDQNRDGINSYSRLHAKVKSTEKMLSTCINGDGSKVNMGPPLPPGFERSNKGSHDMQCSSGMANVDVDNNGVAMALSSLSDINRPDHTPHYNFAMLRYSKHRNESISETTQRHVNHCRSKRQDFYPPFSQSQDHCSGQSKVSQPDPHYQTQLYRSEKKLLTNQMQHPDHEDCRNRGQQDRDLLFTQPQGHYSGQSQLPQPSSSTLMHTQSYRPETSKLNHQYVSHNSKHQQDRYSPYSLFYGRHSLFDQSQLFQRPSHNLQKQSNGSTAGAESPVCVNRALLYKRGKSNCPPRRGCASGLHSPNNYKRDLSSELFEESLQCRCGVDDSEDPEKVVIRDALRLALIQCRPEENENGVVHYNTSSSTELDSPEVPHCRTPECSRKPANQWISSSLVPTPEADNWLAAGQDEVDGTILQLPARVRPTRASQNAARMTGGSPPVESFKKFRSLDFQMRFENVFTTDPSSICSPLPFFNWAESSDVWKNMLKKELTFQRDPGMFKNHPELQPRMRSILLDWLSEVCEVYRLHKETFMLTVDFIDRYLSVTTNVPKTQLQLLGISALFVAAKLEEIYPPKLHEFAYVTDSACTEQEIIKQEMIIVKALKWNLTPMTTNAWLMIYLQVANIDHIHDPALGFVFPQFSTHAFIQISRLCDLCVMDAGSLQYRYSLIAAAALYHHTNEHVVKEVSGLNWADLYPCVRWMAPFAKAILEVGQSPMKFFPQISNENAHNIQTHNVDMALLDRSLTHQAQMDETEAPLDLTSQLVCLLEPPSPPTQATERDYSTGSDLADPPHDSEMAPNSDIAESNALSASVRPPFLGNAGLESESEEDMDQQQRACS